MIAGFIRFPDRIPLQGYYIPPRKSWADFEGFFHRRTFWMGVNERKNKHLGNEKKKSS